MPNNFERPKEDKISDFLAERGTNPHASPESIDEQRSLWSDIQTPSSGPEGAADPDLIEERRAEAARMRDEAEKTRAEADAKARASFRKSTTISGGQSSSEPSDLPRFPKTPKQGKSALRSFLDRLLGRE